jgi:hypothetical protein
VAEVALATAEFFFTLGTCYLLGTRAARRFWVRLTRL